jgi:PAT family beta-lactamase induction signal transducer AmpG
METWENSLKSYLDRRILSIFFLGFSSGLPFLLTLSTLAVWLTESGIDKTIIGLFTMTTLPYTFKFLWGPVVDRLPLPPLTTMLGKRRGWALVTQLAVVCSLVGLGSSNPMENIWATALMAFCVAFSSAMQDMVIEAYRIELMDEQHAGTSAAASSLGYRIGMLVSGAGALYLADIMSWDDVYCIMSLCVVVGMITLLLSPRTKSLVPSSFPRTRLRMDESTSLKGSVTQWLRQTYLPPLKQLLNNNDWRVVLAFILFYKVGDTAINVMNAPFLLELGFSKIEIANVAKLFGISSMIVGGFLGGILLTRFGILTSLMLCATLQVLSSLMFVIQAIVGYNLEILVITIGVENLTCGLGASAFIAYLSSMCSQPNTATHFALLSSFGSMARVFISSFAGWLADQVSWESFFLITAIGSVPCMFLLIRLPEHFPGIIVPAPQETRA